MYTYICSICKKPYSVKWKIHDLYKNHYCSKTCLKERAQKPITFTCFTCGKAFSKIRNLNLTAKRHFCSIPCLLGRGRARPNIELICPICKKQFIADGNKYYRHQQMSNNNAICCSNKCRAIYIGSRIRHKYSPFTSIFYACYRNCKHVPCDLKIEDIKELWDKQQGKCAYTGIPMDLPITSRKIPRTLSKVSVDRIDPNLHYTKNNIQLVCQFVNLGKNKYSDEETKKFISAIIKNAAPNKDTTFNDFSI